MRRRATRRWWVQIRHQNGRIQVVNEECTEFTGGGEELDPVKLFADRKDEEEFVTKHEVFEENSAAECWRETGKAPDVHKMG